jgi:hypothetical protein
MGFPRRVNTNSGCSPRQLSITDLATRFKTTNRSKPFFTKARGTMNTDVSQHLHAVGAFVDEQIRMMGSRFTEHIHDAGQRFGYPGAHVERFHREPVRIDPDHLISSLSSNAHSPAADAGHSMLTFRPLRRTSMRIALSVGLGASDTGMNPSDPCIAMPGSVVRIAIGLPLRSAFLTQSRSMFAFRPRARATAATDTPGCWHAPIASAS